MTENSKVYVGRRTISLAGSVVLIVLLSFLNFSCGEKQAWTLDSEQGKIRVEQVTDGISVPFAMAFLPDGRLVVTDRPTGMMILVDTKTGEKIRVKGVPEVSTDGDGGIFDVFPHPDFARNNKIFFCYASQDKPGATLAVESGVLKGNVLSDRKTLFKAKPYFEKYNFFGSRLLYTDGYLFITTGVSKQYQDSAQTLTNHQGKIIRIKEDGSVPADNPYVKVPGALPENWCIGTRNPQGLTLNPFTHEVWENEHGPKGGDEVNIIQPGKNYGWPVISHGIDYDGSPVGTGITAKEGMEQPLYFYKPSIAPSGMEFYTGDAFTKWKGNVFIGGMVLKHLNRLELKDGKVVHEERLLSELDKRVRCVRQGPDGFLYVGVDGGKILRVRPD